MDEETALIADDSLLMCDRLEEELIDLGISKCIKVQNGQEAFKVYQASAIDITFLDIGMPVMDGLQALQRIKSETPEAYVVIASGTSMVEKVKTAIKLGANGFMVKSYSTEKLREVVQNFRVLRAG